MTVLGKGPDGPGLNDMPGFGGGHVPPPAPARVLFDGTAGGLLIRLGLRLGHKFADGLSGVLKGRVRRVHLHLGHDGAHGHVGNPPVQQLLPKGVLQVIADIRLAHSAADRQGCVSLRGVLLLESGHGVVDDAHLGTVAVGHNDLVAVLNEVHNGPGSDLHRLRLLGKGAAQSVAAQGDDNAFAHSVFLVLLNISSDSEREYPGYSLFC